MGPLLSYVHEALGYVMTAKAGNMELSTIFACIFFGTNFLLCLLFQLIHRQSSKKLPEVDNGKKKLSKPFEGTIECFTNLTWDLFLVGGIVFITYICEHHWIYPHSQKEYSRDLFMFVCFLFFAVAYYSIKPVKDLSLLSRDQTEEWKGWMQFIFLLYHYFHAEEVYNSVRVMITCYVWMTGFGNFSFFYIKQDFGWLRFVQMLWRLNFSVILLMFAHNNTYILYYICPLHTFYFTVVYLTMYIASSVNHSKWNIRVKVFILGCIIFVIWDTTGRTFDLVWGWLGTESMVGAKMGTLWEWYFRSSLDHYSTYFGMIFALNFPLAEQYFKSARGYPLYFAAVVLAGLSVWWYNNIYSLEKMEYNLVHNYFAFIPLTAYIFFRNITPEIRSKVSMSLHTLGKTTLETYLLQHHVWLTSNAKTLLTIVPDMPWVNFFFASALFFILSKELYRLTMTLRGMVLPDNSATAARNLFGGAVLFAFSYGVAVLVHYVGQTLFAIFMACLFCFLVLSFIIRRQNSECKANKNFLQTWKTMFVLGSVMALLGVLSGSIIVPTLPEPNETAKDFELPVLSTRCRRLATYGKWTESIDCTSESSAFCHSSEWKWLDDSCPFHHIKKDEGMGLFKDKKLKFVGDSQIRNMYHSFNSILTKDYVVAESSDLRHSDLHNENAKSNIALDFIWAPYLKNISSFFKENCASGDYYIVGATLWDALYLRNVEAYKEQLNVLSDVLKTCGTTKQELKRKLIWLQPPEIIDSRLKGDEKKRFMNEEKVKPYRIAVNASPMQNSAVTIINPINVTRGMETLDGVHYVSGVYSVLAEIMTNVLKADNGLKNKQPAKPNPFPHGKPTGSMSDPVLGLCILIVSGVMIFGWDSWLGVGLLSLTIFGVKLDWERAYRPLLDKIKPETTVVDEEKESLIEMESKKVDE